MATFKEMNLRKFAVGMICWSILFLNSFAIAERPLKDNINHQTISLVVDQDQTMEKSLLTKVYNFLWQAGGSSYQPVWPVSLLILSSFSSFFCGLCHFLLCFWRNLCVFEYIVFDGQDMEFGWRIVVGSFIGFLGAALGSVGGVGGGGIFVPMLTLIIGFDPKSSTAISKCGYTPIFQVIKEAHRSLY